MFREGNNPRPDGIREIRRPLPCENGVTETVGNIRGPRGAVAIHGPIGKNGDWPRTPKRGAADAGDIVRPAKHCQGLAIDVWQTHRATRVGISLPARVRRAEECVDPGLYRDGIGRIIARKVQLQRVVQAALFDIRQQKRQPSPSRPRIVEVRVHRSHRRTIRLTNVAGREDLVFAFKAMEGQPNLLEIVLALGSPARFTGALHGGQQYADQRADDGDNNQKFDQGKSPPEPAQWPHDSAFLTLLAFDNTEC